MIFIFFRNYFLDFDSLGHVSALEQNFNPIKNSQRENLNMVVSVLFSGKKKKFPLVYSKQMSV